MPQFAIHEGFARQRRFGQAQHQVHGGKCWQDLSKGFAGQALDLIAQDGAARQTLWNHQAQPSSSALEFGLFIATVTQLEATAAQSQRTGHNGREFLGYVQTIRGPEGAKLRIPLAPRHRSLLKHLDGDGPWRDEHE